MFFQWILVLILSASSRAHEGHSHSRDPTAKKAVVVSDAVHIVYQEINEDYQKNVKGLFEAKCAACHSLAEPAPWYAKVPGVGWLIEFDRSEAKVHLEISAGFPFVGHGEPDADLRAIETSVKKNTMPPILYSTVHPSAVLTEEDRSKILEWIQRSSEKLAKATKKKQSD